MNAFISAIRTQAESFPIDGHQAILNKANKTSKTNRMRTYNDNYQQKHRLGMVSNKLPACNLRGSKVVYNTECPLKLFKNNLHKSNVGTRLIKAVAGQGSSPELGFANKSKMLFSEQKTRIR